MIDVVKVQETDDGELFITRPDEMLDRLGWREGDDLAFNVCDNNTVRIKKINTVDEVWNMNRSLL